MEIFPNPDRELVLTTRAPDTTEESPTPRSVSSLTAALVTEPATSAGTASRDSQNTQNTPNRGWSYRYPTCRNDASSCKDFIGTAIYPGGSLADIAEITNTEDTWLCVWICNLIQSRFFSLVGNAAFLAGCYILSLVCLSGLTLSWLNRWLGKFLMRWKIRLHFDIDGSKREDCALSLLCEKFVIHQVLEELKYRQAETGYSHFNIPMIFRNRSQIMRT